MKYLLSDNTTTESTVKYIQDFIRLNMSIRKDEIPYYDGGINPNLETVLVEEVKEKISKMVNGIVDRLSDIGDTKVSFIDSFIDADKIQIQININNTPYTYDISTGSI